MKKSKYLDISITGFKPLFTAARVGLIVLLLGWSQAVFCLNDAETKEKLPFTFEFPVSQEHSIRLITDTSATSHCCPLLGRVISQFGKRGGRTHAGVDVKLKRGDTVRAAIRGVVKMAQTYSGYGKLVILTHPEGYETYYAHLSKCLVSKGDTVYAGQTVGLGGRTGRATTDHLHFEVRKNGSALNPEIFFGFANGELKKSILFGGRELFIASSKKPKTPVAGKQVAEKETTIEMNHLAGKDAVIEPSVDVNTADSYVTIQKGDTLYSLARRYGTTVKQLQDLNNLSGNLLKIGMKLRVN